MKIEEKENGTIVLKDLPVDEYIWLETPMGKVGVFVGEHFTSVTSWVDNTHFTGFYSKEPMKRTQSVCEDYDLYELKVVRGA